MYFDVLFYEPSFFTTMMLFLRRTLVHSEL